MRQIVLLRRAKSDLLEIQKYTQEVWGDTKVLELQELIQNSFQLISFSPFAGRVTRNSSIFVKVVHKVPFIIVYEVSDTYIYIVSITHTKRNR